MNKIELVRRISDVLGDLIIEGTADAADGGSITDTELTYPLADQPKGHNLYIHTGQGAGQSALIASFNTGSYAAIPVPSFATVPTGGDQYFVFKEHTWNQYSRLVDMAVIHAARIGANPFTATLNIVGTQYRYPVPSGFKYVNRIAMAPSGSSDYDLENRFTISRKGWSIRMDSSGTFCIYFNPQYISMADFAGETLQVMGMKAIPTLSSPTSNWEGPDDYVINHALMHLANQKMTGAEGEGWLRRYYAYRNEVDKLEKHIMARLPASSVKVEY